MFTLFGLRDPDVGTGKAQLLGQHRRRTFKAFARKTVGFHPLLFRCLRSRGSSRPPFARLSQRFTRLRGPFLGNPQRRFGLALRPPRRFRRVRQPRALLRQGGDRRRQPVGLLCQPIALGCNRLAALYHGGDPLRRLACPCAPALGFRVSRSHAFTIARQSPVGQGLIRLQLADSHARLLARLRKRCHQRPRPGPVRHRRARSVHLVIFGPGCAQISARFGQSLLDCFPPPGQPFQRRSRFIGSTKRRAQPLVGRAKLRPRSPQRLGRRPFFTSSAILRRACRLDLSIRRRSRRSNRLQPIEPDQPLGRRRAALGRDIAVPAPQLTILGHQPLSHRQRLSIIRLGDRDLRQPPRQFRRRAHMICQGSASSGQGRIALQRRRPSPTPRALRADRRLQVIAQRGGQRPLKARCGLQLIQRPFAPASALDRSLERRRLAIQRRQSRPCG